MPQPNVCDLLKGQRFEGFLLVRSSDQRTGGNGAKYLDLNLADRTGEVNAKVWDGNVPPPAPGSVVKVRGGTLEYNGRLQLRVERIRAMTPSDGVDLSALTPCAPEAPEAMLRELYDAVDAFQSQPLRDLTTGMLRTARAVVGVYPWLNADLLYAGVILHDLCKTEEMISDNLGVVRDYSREGLLLGHLVLGVTRIQEAANDLGISGEPVLLLEHMLLSHHGEAEYGSPRKPMFPEAEVLHWVDLLDARMNEMSSAIAKVKPGVFSDKIWSLDRRLYHADYDALTPDEDKG